MVMEDTKKEIKRYKYNPSIYLVGHLLEETKRTIRIKSTRLAKVGGKLDTIINEDRARVYRDTSRFVKIYMDSSALLEFALLSMTAQKLLVSIIERLEYNKDWFYNIPGVFAKEVGILANNISIYINELIRNEWIFRSDEKHKYWINLCYFCIGDREKIYKDYKNIMS